MSTAPRRFWQEMTTAEFARLDHARVIALLPVGAIEQHGPHLPVAVDACINAGIVARALELLPGDLPVTVLPMLPVGKSDEHLAFPGTLTLSAETLVRLWTEVGLSVARAGVRKLVLFNSHGGQPQVMEIVARDLRVRLGMVVVAYSWYAAGLPQGLFPEDEVRHGIHAGAIETSMMLHLRPELVQMDQAANFAPLIREMADEGYRLLSPTGPARLAWQAQDLHPSGAAGDARNADAERGRALVDHAARALVDLLREVDRFPPDRLRPA
jgi:creatinine amidohydrolase